MRMPALTRTGALVLLVVFAFTIRASAQTEEAQRYQVWGFSALDPTEPKPWSEPYDTEAQADQRLQEILRDHGRGGLLENDPNRPSGLHVRKNGVISPPKKKSPLDSLKAARDRLRSFYQQVKGAREQLISFRGKISPSQLSAVNDSIARYNQNRATFRETFAANAISALAECPLVSPVSENDLLGKLREADAQADPEDPHTMKLDELLRRAEEPQLKDKERDLLELLRQTVKLKESGKSTAELEGLYNKNRDEYEVSRSQFIERKDDLVSRARNLRERRDRQQLELALALEKERVLALERQAEAARQQAATEKQQPGAGPPYFARPRGDVIIPGKYNFLEDGLVEFKSYEEAAAWLRSMGRVPGSNDSILRDKNYDDVP